MSEPCPQAASDSPELSVTLAKDKGPPRLITDHEIIGWMAYWAIRQHPYGRPDGLFEVTDAITEAAKSWPEGISSLRMWTVSRWSEIERWLEATLKDHPVLAAWNTPRSGHTQQIVAVSRYWGPKPEHDFIDIGALLRNVARSTWRQSSE